MRTTCCLLQTKCVFLFSSFIFHINQARTSDICLKFHSGCLHFNTFSKNSSKKLLFFLTVITILFIAWKTLTFIKQLERANLSGKISFKSSAEKNWQHNQLCFMVFLYIFTFWKKKFSGKFFFISIYDSRAEIKHSEKNEKFLRNFCNKFIETFFCFRKYKTTSTLYHYTKTFFVLKNPKMKISELQLFGKLLSFSFSHFWQKFCRKSFPSHKAFFNRAVLPKILVELIK